MIRRGCIYWVQHVFRDPKARRLVLVMTGDARNLDPRSPTVVGIPITSSHRGGLFRVRLRKGEGGLPEASEAACEQIVQVAKRSFVTDARGVVRSLGSRLDDQVLDAVVTAVTNVVSA